ncbi:MAG: molybdopterin-dependent oxidoreductase [Alphaproteobacteria bacterium]|nr:molybdopterin-dependent oxidoreductase [Alphaproteobacteria bacterium]
MQEGRAVKTTCPYCGVGCGVIATPRGDGGLDIAGDPDHPANFGRLCSKGSALGETVSLDDRLLAPRIHGEDTDWPTAIAYVARSFKDIIARHGPDAVALYVSGQLLTEDYYVANKFAKGFLGTANIDTNSRLCMASSVAGHKRAFGSDTVPQCYEDLERTELAVLVGSNMAWCHPVLFQRLMAAKERRGTRIVVIDPRKTATAKEADLHLAITPGSDVALFNGLLAALAEKGMGDERFIAEHTEGMASALAVAKEGGLERFAQETGLSQPELERFYRLFANTPRVLTLYSQGVNQSSAGTDKVNAIINCHLYTGRIGKPGTGPFSLTGQPNAMGGREVGGLANQLAAHMEIGDAGHRDLVAKFWQTRNLARAPGLKAVDLFHAVRRGKVKAVWIMATNPAESMPEAGEVVAALKDSPFLAVSDMTASTRTARLAHVLLPATGWGEKDGTVTNSERRISRQRAFLAPAGLAKPDWWIIAQVAQAMGFPGFAYARVSEIYREHAALSAFRNEGARDFDIGAHRALPDEDYEALSPFQWPLREGGDAPSQRLFADGGFFTQSGKAQAIPTPIRGPQSATDSEFPYILNTGRIRDHWHTMTRTGKSARLSAHIAEPFLDIHPEDAARETLSDADLCEVISAHGKLILRVRINEGQQRGGLFAPIHWAEPFAACAQPSRLIAGNTDPISGQPELKHMPVRLRRFAPGFHAFLVLDRRPRLSEFPYWALARTKGGWRAEFAGSLPNGPIEDVARKILEIPQDRDGEFLSTIDTAQRTGRFAYFRDGKLAGALFVSRRPVMASRGWASECLGATFAPAQRLGVLAGRPGTGQADRGALICACLSIGANQIMAAARAHATSVAAIGEAVKAGTQCGSCRPEIRRILEGAHVSEAV